jgi:Protein of unknown function (DUF2934)
MQDLEQSIRERAYQLWIEGGYQDGHADAHWLSAQREILSTSLSHLGHVTHAETPLTVSKSRAKASRKKQRAA